MDGMERLCIDDLREGLRGTRGGSVSSSDQRLKMKLNQQQSDEIMRAQ